MHIEKPPDQTGGQADSAAERVAEDIPGTLLSFRHLFQEDFEQNDPSFESETAAQHHRSRPEANQHGHP